MSKKPGLYHSTENKVLSVLYIRSFLKKFNLYLLSQLLVKQWIVTFNENIQNSRFLLMHAKSNLNLYIRQLKEYQSVYANSDDNFKRQLVVNKLNDKIFNYEKEINSIKSKLLYQKMEKKKLSIIKKVSKYEIKPARRKGLNKKITLFLGFILSLILASLIIVIKECWLIYSEQLNSKLKSD